MKKRILFLSLFGLGLLLQAQEAPNLLAKMPATKFWYPPYSSWQPDASSGTFTLDLKKAAGKDLAVFEIELPAGMEPGVEYLLTFKAKSVPNCDLIVLVPEADPEGKKTPDGNPSAKSDWGMHNGQPKQRSIEFIYDPKVEQQKIQFYWNKQHLAKKGVFTFSDFSLKKLD